MSTGTNKERIEQNNQKLGEIKTAISNLPDTLDANATPKDIVIGKSAYVAGEKIDGIVDEMQSGQSSFNTITSDMLNGTVLHYIYPSDVLNRKNSSIEFELNTTDVGEALGITPTKIVKGNTICQIEGTAELGLDTSDATAVAGDIASGKTAYSNGEKITGTIVTGETGSETEMSSTSVEWSSFQNALYAYEDFTQDYLFRRGARLSLRVPTNVLAEAIGLTADKIKAGEVIMGITGTYEGDYTSTLTPEEYTTALDTASSILNDDVTE